MNILIVCQVFYPDQVSVSQHLTDFAEDLIQKGHSVDVMSGRHQYEIPSIKYLPEEKHKGIRIKRIWSSSFSKKTKIGRVLNFLTFNVNMLFQLLLNRNRYDRVIGLTVPPMLPLIVATYSFLKKVPFVYWIMDLWPDQGFAAGVLRRGGLLEWIGNWLGELPLKRAVLVFALDRFMKERIVKKGIDKEKVLVSPPWSVVEDDLAMSSEENIFRKQHSFKNKTVIMFSGNHSVCHPLDTVLEASEMLNKDARFLFVFIGGGVRVNQVSDYRKKNNLKNIVQLPFQPKEMIKYSLTAADIHLVVMGDSYVGINHPCKIYGVLAIEKPFVFVGPEECHVKDLMNEVNYGYFVQHGESEKLVDILRDFRRQVDNDKPVEVKGGREIVKNSYSRKVVINKMINSLQNLQPNL